MNRRPRAGRLVITTLVALMAGGAMQRVVMPPLAIASVAGTQWPYFPGSRTRLRVNGIAPPYGTAIAGPGVMLEATLYAVPLTAKPDNALLVVGNAAGLGTLHVRIASPPDPRRPLLLVASYRDGLVVHDASNFSVYGVLGIAGAAGDVSVDRNGRGIVADTQGDTATLLALRPWSVRTISGVPTGDETLEDPPLHAAFVTNRERNGSGALTRVDYDGTVAAVATGDTAEGIALDATRQIVYVANVNDGTIASVDARSMRVLRRFFAVDRIFSLAIAPDGSRLYAVANTSETPPMHGAGSVIAIAPFPRPHVVARSAGLSFPIGVALDPTAHTLFVSDEATAQIDVLDSRTLRPLRAPLKTCAIPWKLTFDGPSERLYVPCAGDNAVDAFDTPRLRRIKGAPFTTGGYPLAIAVWRG